MDAVQTFCKNLCKGPALKIEKARCQFQEIWRQNIVLVKVVKRKKDTDVIEGGDFFETQTGDVTYSKLIWLNLQGVSSNSYHRIKQGISTHGSVYHAYALWNEQFDGDDLIVFIKGFRGDTIGQDSANDEFVIHNHNRSFYGGNVLFQEFDLVKVGQHAR